jgi:hypothetical protein
MIEIVNNNVFKMCRVCLKWRKRYYSRLDEDTVMCEDCMNKILILGALQDALPSKRYIEDFRLFENGVWIRNVDFRMGVKG